jgi:hypothetical protein
VTLGEIKELVDHISETWRRGAPADQRTDLADLDAALAELDEQETETNTAIEAVEHLRGRIEVLMDEIDITLGIEPTPIDPIDEFEAFERVQPMRDEDAS